MLEVGCIDYSDDYSDVLSKANIGAYRPLVAIAEPNRSLSRSKRENRCLQPHSQGHLGVQRRRPRCSRSRTELE